MSNEIIKILDDLAGRLGVVIDWNNKNILWQKIYFYVSTFSDLFFCYNF